MKPRIDTNKHEFCLNYVFESALIRRFIFPKSVLSAYLKIIIPAIFGGLIFSGCTVAPQNLENEKSLRIATSYKIQNLAPQESASYFLIEYGIAETPLFLDDEGNLKPNLLESYRQIDDLNWKLTLRENIFFHNGKPLTADALAAAINFQSRNSPATRSVLSNFTIKKTGERELILTTDAPNSNVPAALSDEDGFPVFDVECIENADRDNQKIIDGGCYTGAYRAKSLDDREMILEKFSQYWQGMPPLETVVVKFVPDAQTRILAVQSGEADIALYAPAEAKRILANKSNAFFKASEAAAGGPRLWFNTKRSPFADVELRRAVAFGIKYESLANEVFDSVFQVADGFYPPVYKFAVQNQKTDLAEARRILDEAGWTLNQNNLREKNGTILSAVLLTYPQQPDWVTLATAIQANLRDIGFDIKIRQVDDINAALKAGDWDLAINSPGIMTGGGSPDSALEEFLTTNGEKNYGGVSDAELNNLIETLSRTFDAEKRIEILRRIQQIVIAEKVFELRPLFSRSRIVVGKRFKNYQPSPRLHHVTFETKPDE